MQHEKEYHKRRRGIFTTLIVILGLLMVAGISVLYINKAQQPTEDLIEVDPESIVDGIHLRTGLIDDQGLQMVINNCTTCHSAKLVIQNRMGAEQWNATIRWMQKTQGLWPLGEQQDVIVRYLVKNYPPLEKGRRAALTHIDWYELEQQSLQK